MARYQPKPQHLTWFTIQSIQRALNDGWTRDLVCKFYKINQETLKGIIATNKIKKALKAP